jgi:hypothetical protein
MAPDALAEVGTAEQIPMELSKDGASACCSGSSSLWQLCWIRKHQEAWGIRARIQALVSSPILPNLKFH